MTDDQPPKPKKAKKPKIKKKRGGPRPPPKKKPGSVTMPCLKCSEDFESIDKSRNRICADCRLENANLSKLASEEQTMPRASQAPDRIHNR